MADKQNFDPRKLMEKAINAMKFSKSDPRKDGKISPKVGAARCLNGQLKLIEKEGSGPSTTYKVLRG